MMGLKFRRPAPDPGPTVDQINAAWAAADARTRGWVQVTSAFAQAANQIAYAHVHDLPVTDAQIAAYKNARDAFMAYNPDRPA